MSRSPVSRFLSGLATTFRSLKQRNYRLWWSGSVLSNIGTWVQRIAQDWLVLELTHNSGTALGVVTALQFGPSLLFSVFGGALADRANRRVVLLITNTSGALLSLLLGLLVLDGSARIWHVYLISAVAGAVWAFDVPSRQAFVNELVPPEHMPNAVALNAMSFNLGRLVGPAVSGYLIEGFGTGLSFFINAASFLPFLISLMFIRTGELHPQAKAKDHEEPMWQRTRAGFAYVRKNGSLLRLFVIVAVVGSLGMNYQVWMALMAKHEFHRNAGSFGLLGSAMAIGSVTGAVLAARRRRKPNLDWVLMLALVFAAALGLSACSPTYEVYALTLPFCGMIAITLLTSANATMQLSTEEGMRGRVAGIYFMVFTGGSPIGSPLVGWVAETFGTRWSMAMGAVAVLATSLVLRAGRRAQAAAAAA
jgi:MFS family permease